MLTRAPRCGVCGWRGKDDVCPQCGTVLLRGRALCRRCGKVFEGPIARCDACGGEVLHPATPAASEAVERLSHLPGVDEDTARKLQARGFRDPADLLQLALPERAVRMGVHRSLARKIVLGEIRPVRRVKKTVLCLTCGAPREPHVDSCPACGSPWERGASPEEARRTLAEVVGEVYDLMADRDFRGLPDEVREEILDAFESEGFPPVDGEYAEQFREWRG